MNAMTLDIAMGGSTNTVLHLLAVAHEAGVDFTMKDIDALSRKTPCLCKVSPSSHYHIEDVNRAGGILSLLGELNRAHLLDTSVFRADGLTLGEAIAKYDILSENCSAEALEIFKSAPGRRINLVMGSQQTSYFELDNDRVAGCIRNLENAYYKDGGLAVLYGNIATKGCIVKTAGVDLALSHFEGLARVFESQDEAVHGILSGKVNPGDVVVIRYEGPKGGPGMQEMLYPTSYLKTLKLDKACALITDGRFSGGTSGLSIGHISPEAASGGEIALIRDNDKIVIDIAARSIALQISEQEMQSRKSNESGRGNAAYTPHTRQRTISTALKIYAKHVSSADTGAVRIIE
jgi:dihydroxy-acid dehydratase